MNPQRIKFEAEEFARKNKESLAKKLTDISVFIPDEFPVSVFMAGSPGAGKTESSRNLIINLTTDNRAVLRIDPDELRPYFDSYNGKNSSLFIYATSILADKMQDLALIQRQSLVFDGTLSNLDRSRENITRSLQKERYVQIVYVYQDPLQAWNFVKARERKDGRSIPKDAFIKQYFSARENVNLLKEEFSGRIEVDLIVKNIDGTDFRYHDNVNSIDNFISEPYTLEQLEQLIDIQI